MGADIGRSLRAARERRGWSREALAYHAGVSWAAITQIESGRRIDVRLSSLVALARALGVGIDQLVRTSEARPPDPLEHRALVYGSDEELVAELVPFLLEGVQRGEDPLVVITPARIRQLRDALGDAAEGVRFEDAAPWYSSPLATLDRYREYLDDRLAAGCLWLRIVGEPVWEGRSPAERREWTRYESLVNLSFASAPATLVCPYDRRTAPRAIVAHAERTHPELIAGGGATANARYETPESYLI